MTTQTQTLQTVREKLAELNKAINDLKKPVPKVIKMPMTVPGIFQRATFGITLQTRNSALFIMPSNRLIRRKIMYTSLMAVGIATVI